MARAARRQGGSEAGKKGYSRRARSAQLEQLNLHAAGIDVGADAHWVAVPKDRDEQPVQQFGTFTADLYALAEWLRQCQIETVVMGIVKLLGIIVSPGNSRHFPDAIATNPPFRRPALSL
jgi:hypothetical protein